MPFKDDVPTAAEYFYLSHVALAQADATRDPEASHALRQIGYGYIVKARALEKQCPSPTNSGSEFDPPADDG